MMHGQKVLEGHSRSKELIFLFKVYFSSGPWCSIQFFPPAPTRTCYTPFSRGSNTVTTSNHTTHLPQQASEQSASHRMLMNCFPWTPQHPIIFETQKWASPLEQTLLSLPNQQAPFSTFCALVPSYGYFPQYFRFPDETEF